MEGYFPDRPDDYLAQILSVLGRIGDAVPRGMELGYHLCYGSPKDEHLIQPRDATVMVDLMRQTLRQVRRPIQYFHIPVPKERGDAAFYRPLSSLNLPRGTELYLGLVHLNDDGGNRQRLEVARQFTAVTGVATECGWGRGNPANVVPLLESFGRLIGSQPAHPVAGAGA